MVDEEPDGNSHYTWGARYFLPELSKRMETFPSRYRTALRVSCTPGGELRMSMGYVRDNGIIKNGTILAPVTYTPVVDPDRAAYTFIESVESIERNEIMREVAMLEYEGFKVTHGEKDVSEQIDILVQMDNRLEVLVAAVKPSTMIGGRLIMRVTSPQGA